MTRLKTICLSLCMCIGLANGALYAQSSSCAKGVNLTVDAYCDFTLSVENLRATGPAASSNTIKFRGVDQVFTLYNGQLSASLFDLDIPRGGTLQYQLFESTDGTGPMACWGEVTFEVKSIPDPFINRVDIMCSESFPELPTLADLQAEINGLCIAPITDLTVSSQVEGSACEGFRTIRKITGIVDYGSGTKVTADIRIDTIVESPLDTGMVVCPLGGPDKQDAIILFCDSIGNSYPTPEIVEEYSREGIRAAYPYIAKGLDTTIVFIEQVVSLEDTTEEKVLVTDDAGTEYWVLTEVIAKRDTLVMVPDTTIEDIVLPLRGGPTCNLSTKYTDETYPGCAGADSKILRTWSVLDWCNGSLKECVQWIIVETAGPIIEPHDSVYVGIAPWLCSASYSLSSVIDRGCSDSLQVIYKSSAGVIEDNKLLTNLWLGDVAEVTVTAIDDCGQRSVDTFYVTPIDSIAPTAVAEDQVNVSLSGDPIVVEPEEDRGVAKVYIDAIDAGSHNAGCGEVTRCVLLKEELEDPVIFEGVHVEVNGELIYHAHGCEWDGVLPSIPATKTTPGRPAIPYVICKDYVKFCCESIGLNSVAMVVTNGGNRQARTWTDVLVEDKSSPIVICPQPFKVGCDEDYDIPEPVIFNGVCSIDELEMTSTEDFDNCGDGIKTIVWTRNGDVICTSQIIVDGTSGFNPYEIKWPKHYNNDDIEGVRRECELLVDDDGDAILDDNDNEQYIIVEYDELVPMGQPFECTEEGFTGEPVWCTSTCGLVGVNFEDQDVEAIQACRKIIRRWTIIDWCSWDPNEDLDDEADSFDQFTAVNDEWLGAGDWLTDSRSTLGEKCEECDKPAGSADFIYFRYDTVDVDGYYTFSQVIKILDFDSPEVTAPDTINLSISGGATAKGDDFDDCVASDVVSASVTDMCGDAQIDASGAGWFIQVFALDDGQEVLLNTKEVFGETATMGTSVGQSGDVHKIRWIVRDGCGNVGSTETYIIFREDKKPTPLCIQTLSTSTMSSDGSSVIWATDFDAGSFDNCSEVDLFFKDELGNFTPSLTFNCEDITDGQDELFDIELYAIDELGNFDFCNVSLRVSDFNDNCEDTRGVAEDNEVAGKVATAFGDRVEDVEISLNIGETEMTSVQGRYAFEDITSTSLEISAEKKGGYLNGVSSLDVVLIQRHLLGQQLFETPYQVIAADANNDSRISALDIVEIRKLILGIYDEFPRNESWRFVDAAQQFDDPLLPFPFVESINISNFSGGLLGQNFTGVKIGDVNGNAIANSLLAGETRNQSSLNFVFDNTQVRSGEQVKVGVSSDNFQDIIAYQYTMELSGLTLEGVEPGYLEIDESNFGFLDEDVITTSWYSADGISTKDVLYYMIFKATDDMLISEGIEISSKITPAIAYNANQESMDINSSYNIMSSKVSDFVLYQNIPNPFSESTSIKFDIPSSGMVKLQVFDVTGRVLLDQSGSFNAGQQTIQLDRSSIGAAGVLYYQLDYISDTSGSEMMRATKKMILIE